MEVLKLRGCLRLQMLDLSGVVLEERLVENLFVTAGRSWILGQLETVNQNTALSISHIALGSVTVVQVSTNSALAGELLRVAIVTFASLLTVFLRAHIANVKRLQKIETELEIIYNWFQKHVIKSDD